MKRAVYFLGIAVILLSFLATTCAGSKAQPQLSASGTTCSVRNNGPTGDVKVIFYQVPDVSISAGLLCKQWVVFTLAEGEEITLDFSIITDPSQVGSGRYYVSGSLPEGAHGGSEKAQYTIATTGSQSCIDEASGSVLEEFQSSDCYHSGSSLGYLLGFRVE